MIIGLLFFLANVWSLQPVCSPFVSKPLPFLAVVDVAVIPVWRPSHGESLHPGERKPGGVKMGEEKTSITSINWRKQGNKETLAWGLLVSLADEIRP
jgi:hypothetical protein